MSADHQALSRAGQAAHLVRRFAGSLSRQPPAPDDERWALSSLSEAEQRLWLQSSAADRRHTIGVARRASALRPELETPSGRAVLAACLLHDIGKLDAGLGTWGRVIATLWGGALGDRAERGEGRIARYLRHEPIGAAMLSEIDSEELTVWLVAGDLRAPAAWRELLRQADDG